MEGLGSEAKTKKEGVLSELNDALGYCESRELTFAARLLRKTIEEIKELEREGEL